MKGSDGTVEALMMLYIREPKLLLDLADLKYHSQWPSRLSEAADLCFGNRGSHSPGRESCDPSIEERHAQVYSHL